MANVSLHTPAVKSFIIIKEKHGIGVIEGQITNVDAGKIEKDNIYSYTIEGTVKSFKLFNLRKDRNELEKLLRQILSAK